MRQKPEFLFVFGICLLFLLLGIVGSTQSANSFLSNYAPWMIVSSTLLTGVALIIFLVQTRQRLLKLKKDEMGLPTVINQINAPFVVNQGREYVLEAFRITQRMVENPLLKTNVHMLLELLDYVDNSKSRIQAKMRASYDLTNYSNKETMFPFAAQIDVSKSNQEDPKGNLELRNMMGALVSQRALKFRLGNDSRGLQRLYEDMIPIPAFAAYKVKWWTDKYLLDLPYSEFWATAHPLIGFRIDIDIGSCSGLTAEAECYRPKVEPGHFDNRMQGKTIFVFDAEGVFLPFQGMFLRVHEPVDNIKDG